MPLLACGASKEGTVDTHAFVMNEAAISWASHVSSNRKEIIILLPCQLHLHSLSFLTSPRVGEFRIRRVRAQSMFRSVESTTASSNTLPSLSPLLLCFTSYIYVIRGPLVLFSTLYFLQGKRARPLPLRIGRSPQPLLLLFLPSCPVHGGWGLEQVWNQLLSKTQCPFFSFSFKLGV